MARRPHLARLLLVTSVLGVALAAAPLAAGAQEAPAAPTLAAVLRGEVDGLTAEATTMPTDGGDMGIVVEVTNDGDDPVEVAVPFGTLVVTQTEGDQTLAVTAPPSPEVIDVAARGGTPTVEFEAGTSSRQLPAYCTELGDGYPFDSAPVTPIDDAHPVLAETLRAATVADADHTTTQDAVWWLTDEPDLPVADSLHGLLAVDTAAFAAAPHRVTPDTGYVPMWMREQATDGGSLEMPAYDDEEAAGILDESFEGPGSPTGGSDGGGLGAGPIVWAVLVGLVVVTSVVVASRAGRTRAAPAPALARTAPGWYPDPLSPGGHRYWDGQAWTHRVMGPR
ncbi:MAG TPA: DUF2510 domain-containing protein [Iamia sp.]